ncbi:hypothetical protein EON64_16970 [archaeon]|nr:MAG: hypothetical protein EON64_16970 [archaeon]
MTLPHPFRSRIQAVTHFIEALRATGPLWIQLQQWKAVFWLSLHFNHATSKGGAAQQRRIARYLASELLDEAMSQVAQAIGVEVKSLNELIASVWAFKLSGRVPTKPPAPKYTYTAPMTSPAHGTRIPLVVLREGSYRPKRISLKFSAHCIACSRSMLIGDTVQWARGIGACHAACEWPLSDY